MADDDMVLRTVYIPLRLDRELRAHSFTMGVSKSDLIRRFIDEGFQRFEAEGVRTLADRLDERAKALGKDTA